MIEALLALAVSLSLVAFAIYAHGRSTIHRGKSEAFQEVANDFRGLSQVSWWMRGDKAKAQRERKKHMLSLCLCDPDVCDALREALEDAEEHWNHERTRQRAREREAASL